MKRAVVIVATLSILAASGAAVSALHARVASGRAAHDPAPVGKIAYASGVDGDFEIFVMRPDGTRRRQITHNRVNDVAPSWSPDGTQIVFERDVPSYGDDLYIVDLDGGPATPWVETDWDEDQPSWSPDGESIAFRRRPPENDSDLVLRRVDNSDAYSISEEENTSLHWPVWSPDASKVAFVSEADGAAIHVEPACCDSSDQDYVATATNSPDELGWSRDGSCLVFGDIIGGSFDLYTVPIAGGTAQPLTSTSEPADSYPGSWSPDSSQIVYDSSAARSWDIYVVDADGSDAHRLTKTPKVNEITPDWWAPPGVEPTTPPCGQPTPSPSPSPSAS